MPRLTTISDNRLGIIATNGKLYFAKRHNRPAPWQIFTSAARAQAWLEKTPAPAVIRWS